MKIGRTDIGEHVTFSAKANGAYLNIRITRHSLYRIDEALTFGEVEDLIELLEKGLDALEDIRASKKEDK